MIREYQVTLFCTTNQYKPVSAIVKKDSSLVKQIGKEAFLREVRLEGIKKVCAQRYWTTKELKKYNYTHVKVREYVKERIEQEKRERYEQIKRERGWACSKAEKDGLTK